MYAIEPSSRGRPAITLAPLDPSRRLELERMAAADGHAVIHPTHTALRGGEIVGYASLGTVTMFFAWLAQRRLSGPESFRAWRLAQEAATGAGPVCLPCTNDSPLLPFVERMGYRRIGTAHIHLKEF